MAIEPNVTRASRIVSGWGPAAVPTKNEVDLFRMAVSEQVGLQLEPVAVQCHSVSGMSYCFFCISRPIHPGIESTFVRVRVYAKLPDGDSRPGCDPKPVLEAIAPVHACHATTPTPGGWTSVHAVGGDELQQLKRTTECWVGTAFQPVAVQSQVVAGIQQCFFCIAHPVHNSATPAGMAAVKLYTSPDGESFVTEISTIYPW